MTRDTNQNNMLNSNILTTATAYLQIPSVFLQQLRQLASSARPLEIVGILAGTNETISELIPLENIAADPTREYFASPDSMIRAIKHLKTQHLEIIAFYHSHPNGSATPSITDLQRAQWDVPMLIIDALTLEIRAWQLETNQEVPWQEIV